MANMCDISHIQKPPARVFDAIQKENGLTNIIVLRKKTSPPSPPIFYSFLFLN